VIPHPSAVREVDVLVVGGGPAGLSAALVLGRSRRRVLVVDAGEPRNAPAETMHAFLTRDGISPREFLALGRAEVARYGVEHLAGHAATARRVGDRFEVEMRGGGTVVARHLVVTTGLVDQLPAIDGLAARWGRDVVHCPYCHGWEVRDRAIGVLATSPVALHQAGLFRQLSDRVVVLRHTSGGLDPDRWTALAARGVEMVDGEVVAIEVTDDRLTGVRLADGRSIALEALVVGSPMVARSELLADLGLVADVDPTGLAVTIPSDPMGRTGLAGVWVAGNVTDPSAQVIVAAAQGTRLGAALNADLVTEDEVAAREVA
jgi:thioredoxin reductase